MACLLNAFIGTTIALPIGVTIAAIIKDKMGL